MLVSMPGQARSLIGFVFSFLSLSFILLLQTTTVTGKELKFLLTVYRHGDRSPLATFHTNTHPESTWPQGFGQLTKEGMKQQYKLGQYFRSKYGRFLGHEYKRQIYVQSSDFDRTIMSAQTNLAGLFPPTPKEMFNSRIAWQPIPVHPSPDKLFIYPRFDCPRFITLMRETLNSNGFQLQLKPYLPLIRLIASKLGYDSRTVLDAKNYILWNFYDTIFVQKVHGRRNPGWVDENMISQLKSFLELATTALFGMRKIEEKSRVQGGLLVKDILKRINNFVSNADPRKMIMYSAHDLTLVALQSALNVYNVQLPPYGACHIFELYQERNGQYAVEMHYLTDVGKTPTPLTLPGCSQACPLDKFKQLLEPIMVDDWQAECNKA